MSVVGSRWVDGAPVGGSVVGGSVEHLSVGRWAVVGGLSVGGGRWLVGGRWFCNTPYRKHELFFLNELSLVLIGIKQIQSILNVQKYQGDAKLYI